MSERVKLQEQSKAQLNAQTAQISAETGLPQPAVERLVASSEANAAASAVLQQQMQTYQASAQRSSQLQTDALLRELGQAASLQGQQVGLLQELQTSLAGAALAVAAAAPSPPPAMLTQELAAFMGSTVSGTVRQVAYDMDNMMQHRFRQTTQGQQSTTATTCFIPSCTTSRSCPGNTKPPNAPTRETSFQ